MKVRYLSIVVSLASSAFAQTITEESKADQPGTPGSAIDPPPAKVEVVEEKKEEEAGAEEAVKVVERVTMHTIKPGGSLTAVSEEAYGRTRYWRILKLYNKVDPSKLQVGQAIKAPDIPWLISKSGLEKKYPEAVADLLKVKATLFEVDEKSELTEEDVKKLKEAAAMVGKARTALMAKTDGVTGQPVATSKQLRTVQAHLGHIASKTRQGRTNPKELAHEHLSNAIVYGVLWAEGGFK